MSEYELKDFNFTEAAWESLYDVVDSSAFLEQDAELIYNSLKHRLRFISFGDYLKRYLYTKTELKEPFTDIPLTEYQSIIKSAFSDNYTPPSFTSTTAKLSALSKNWLTQHTVKRNIVFLLGFGLNMSVEDVNMFLTKALREPEINPKNPFEVICWYCYKNKYNYLKFKNLWALYNNTPANFLNMSTISSEQTLYIRNSMCSICDDLSLMSYVSRLKTPDNMPKNSITARNCFMDLYNEARDLIAELYSHSEAEKHSTLLLKYQDKLSRNDRLYDYEKQERVKSFHNDKRTFVREDITERDLERIICAAIPTNRHGNLTLNKASKLNEQFAGKRFSRQHINEILSGNAEITRFDLITLNFFVFSQKLQTYPNIKQRYYQFLDSTNQILEKCFMGNLYIQNPYECFVLMCILSIDPLGTYADVWELSYQP